MFVGALYLRCSDYRLLETYLIHQGYCEVYRSARLIVYAHHATVSIFLKPMQTHAYVRITLTEYTTKETHQVVWSLLPFMIRCQPSEAMDQATQEQGAERNPEC